MSMEYNDEVQNLLSQNKLLYTENFDPSEYILQMINQGDMSELLETYRTLVETEEETDRVFKHIVDQNPTSMEEMVRLPMTYGKVLDGMFNSVVNSKKRIKEIRGHLSTSVEEITANNNTLLRLHFKEKILKAIESINDAIYLTTQKIESGLFYEALQLYQEAEGRYRQLDQGVRGTGVIQRLGELLDSKKSEIRQLCVYFLKDQIFSTEVDDKVEQLLGQIDFGKIVFEVAEQPTKKLGRGFTMDENAFDNLASEEENLLEPPHQKETQKKPKIFGKKRINFIFSIVKSMQNFNPSDFLAFIDTVKLDAMLDVMFDKEVVKMFEDLSKSTTDFSQVDSQVSYYNIFLCVNCIRELEPQWVIADTLLSNLEENFNRIVLNCFAAFQKELFILQMNGSKIESCKSTFFVWESEYVKSLLPCSLLVADIKNIEVISKLLVMISFYCFHYLADFVKLCQFLKDEESLQNNLGDLVVCLSHSLKIVIEKLFLQTKRSKEDEAMLLVGEDINAKCLELQKRLELNSNYFPFIMQLVMRQVNKGMSCLVEAVFPSYREEFSQFANGCVASFCNSLYDTYFLLLKRSDPVKTVSTDDRNLQVFHFKQSDKDQVIKELEKEEKEGVGSMTMRSPAGVYMKPNLEFKVYLPAAEQVKVRLNDICIQFELMRFEHHQRFMLSFYNWCLNQFVQLLVTKFKDDINDYNMNSLKRSLGFKDLLRSDFSFSQFMMHIGLQSLDEEKTPSYLPEEEYHKAITLTYGQLSQQLSSLPIDAFKEGKYVNIAQNCAIVLNCFVSVKKSFNRNFETMLSQVDEKIIRKLINENMIPEDRPSNKIEREAAQKILMVHFMAAMKRSKSDIFKKAEEIYTGIKDQSFEDFANTHLDSQVIMLFYYFTKFDKMLVELYLNLKIIIHLTILIYLSPRFQHQATSENDKVILSGNMTITFFKKYKQLVDKLSENVDNDTLSSLFDESLFIIGTQLEDIVFEVMKYSPKGTGTLLTLITNLQANLTELSIYEFSEDDIKEITKKLKRYLNLYEKVTTEEELLQVIENNPGVFTKKQIINFVLCKNHSAPKTEDLPFSVNTVLKKGGDNLVN